MKGGVLALSSVVWLLVGNTFASDNTLRKELMSEDENVLIIETKSGLMRGHRKQVLGHSVDLFLGVPYAQPPLGELRFKRPVPVAPWKGVLDATKLPNSCQQIVYPLFKSFRGMNDWIPNTPTSEDCLYLNLYVPSRLRSLGDAPVLIWIHGGGYLFGSSTVDLYDGSVLAASNDVIVVTVNYRLGVFGFLNFGHDDAPGNMGLFDQTTALQWIKNNVRHFGGDPESMTLFGESAGAASISAHLVSPVSQGLFKRAIMQSGSLNAPWSFTVADASKTFAKTIAQGVGCNALLPDGDDDVPAIMHCLRAVDGRNLSRTHGVIPWGPTVDGVFLADSPENLLKSGQFGDKEILVGANSNEGATFLFLSFMALIKNDRPTDLSQQEFADVIDKYFQTLSELERTAIKFMYKDWEHFPGSGYQRLQQLSNMIGDYLFYCPLNAFSDKFAKDGANVYYYKFVHRTSSSPWADWMGVVHFDEVEYVFGRPLTSVEQAYTEEERALSYRMMRYFTDFAKTGKPLSNDDWPTYSPEHPNVCYVNDQQGPVVIGQGHWARQCAFWNQLIPALKARKSDSPKCECDSIQTQTGKPLAADRKRSDEL